MQPATRGHTPPGGLCPGLTEVRPAYLKQRPEIGLKLVQVEALAREAMAKNPQVAIDAYVKRQQLAPDVAKATVERECCDRGIPSFAQQVDPKSPYSMTAKDGGLVEKLHLAIEALHIGVALIGVIGLLLNFTLNAVESKIVPWKGR